MVELSKKQKPRRGRILREPTVSSAELARPKAERTKLGLRCQEIFERIRPELIEKYYNWFIAIEPDSEEYLIDSKLMTLIQKVQEQYRNTDAMLTTFRINETGTCGRI